jgi:hypothetical protein
MCLQSLDVLELPVVDLLLRQCSILNGLEELRDQSQHADKNGMNQFLAKLSERDKRKMQIFSAQAGI